MTRNELIKKALKEKYLPHPSDITKQEVIDKVLATPYPKTLAMLLNRTNSNDLKWETFRYYVYGIIGDEIKRNRNVTSACRYLFESYIKTI